MIFDKHRLDEDTDEDFNMEEVYDATPIIDTLSDDQCLALLTAILAKRVQIGTAFLREPDTGLITQSVITLTTEDNELWSEPEEINPPLVVVEEDTLLAYTKDKNDPTIH